MRRKGATSAIDHNEDGDEDDEDDDDYEDDDKNGECASDAVATKTTTVDVELDETRQNTTE